MSWPIRALHRDCLTSRRSFPDLEPLYNACRSYLEISQRIDLLNARVDVSPPVRIAQSMRLTRSDRCYRTCSSC